MLPNEWTNFENFFVPKFFIKKHLDFIFRTESKLVVKTDKSPILNCTEFELKNEKLAAKRDLKNVFNPFEDILDSDDDYDDYAQVDQNVNAVAAKSKFEKEQVEFLFNPFGVELNINNADKNPALFLELNDCQLDYILR